MSKAGPVSASDGTFDSEVMKSNEVVIVDFWAEWCGPCKRIAPILEELASEYAGRAKVVKVDVDANQEVAGRFRIQSIPTLLFFKGGQMVDSVIGAVGKDVLKKKLEAHF
jgi:thioredoxin 1